MPRFEYEINWKMIEEILDFVKSDLLTIFLTDNTSRTKIISKYDLAEFKPKANFEGEEHLHQNVLR